MSDGSKDDARNWAVAALVVMLSCFRLAHAHLLWADEDYHLAAAVQILHGKLPYRDFWYDKPPLSAMYYLLIGGYGGWPLRLLDAAYVAGCCAVLYRLATAWWGAAEGRMAALLLAFYTTFYLPSAVIPFAADAVMLLPHVAAVYCAARRKPLAAGVLCGVAFYANPKAVFVWAVCCWWLWPQVRTFAAGLAGTLAVGCASLWVTGAWPGYVEQVWRWGWQYAAGSPVTHPLQNGIARTANWLGFHAALAVGAVVGMISAERQERVKLLAWIALSSLAVGVGSRFAPHYFLQLLPALILPAAFGLVRLWERRSRVATAVLALTLAVPLARFGPRYMMLTGDLLHGATPNWIDVAMDEDSQQTANVINRQKRSGDTLLVWGYRPDVYVYTRLAADGLFWDSQPLTGVPADRHLSATSTIYSAAAGVNRQALLRSHPVWIVDGLGLLNPRLSPENYPELHQWLAGYRLAGRTSLSLIYRRAN